MNLSSFVHRAAFGRISPWVVAAIAFAGAAAAQTANTRSFVSGLGVDNSNCLMATRPCRTFAYAMNQTATGGVIVALDAAEYGPVSITRGMTILGAAPGTAKISVPAGGTGVLVNAPGASVILRGLEIAGGYDGLYAQAVGTLDIGDTMIAGASNLGLELGAGTTATHDCLLAANSSGISITGGSLVLTRVVVARSGGNSLFNSGGSLSVVDSIVDGGQSGLDLTGGTAIFKHSTIANISMRGINNSGGIAYLDTTTVVGTGQVDVSNINGSATTYSYGNNNIGSTDGTVTPMTPN